MMQFFQKGSQGSRSDAPGFLNRIRKLAKRAFVSFISKPLYWSFCLLYSIIKNIAENDNDELYFRDYLTERPDIAKEYEAMKLKLWKTFEHDRDGYTNAKAEFVRRYTEKAKIRYMNRY